MTWLLAADVTQAAPWYENGQREPDAEALPSFFLLGSPIERGTSWHRYPDRRCR
ncbi:MAG: hypothetical protein ACRDRU_00025 [Pseudonocardiaceae bacterium]